MKGITRLRRSHFSRRTLFVLLILLPLGFVLFPTVTAEGQQCGRQFMNQRKQVQAQRKQLRKRVQKQRRKISESLDRIFRDLLSSAQEQREAGQVKDLKRILDALSRLSYDGVDQLRTKLNALPEPPEESSGETTLGSSSWKQTYKNKITNNALEPLRKLVREAIRYRVNRYAYEFLQLILTLDPDNKKLRGALEQRQYEGEWLTPFAYQRARKGVVWHDRFGWIVKGKLDQYKNGQYFDLRRKTWASRRKLNEYHKKTDKPWTFRTENLKFDANIKILTLVQLARKLETFYRKIFATFSEFFSQGESSYRLIFGLKDHPPLRIRIFKNREEFLQRVPRSPSWAAGLYSPRDQTSYFYGDVSSTMYHEFVHQIVDRFAPGSTGEAPAWLNEGIAVYAEAPSYDEHGDLVLEAGQKIRAYLRARRKGSHMKVQDLITIKSHSAWSRAVENKNSGNPYPAAGALVRFCMDAQNRKYRSDFLDYMKHAYQGRAQCPIWQYLALEREEFLKQFEKWCEEGMN